MDDPKSEIDFGGWVALNKINIDGIKDLVRLLQTFEDVFKLIQAGDKPTLHMVHVRLNKLKLHLEGRDIDNNGDLIVIADRHEGNTY